MYYLSAFAVHNSLPISRSNCNPLHHRRCNVVSASLLSSNGSSPVHSWPLRAITSQIAAFISTLQRVEALTRPGTPAGAAGPLRERYELLPDSAKGPSQMLGRLSPGCEGTHGVFPKCNFGCKPCYHSEDANRVRVDGAHTITEVARQMKLLADLRGPVAHCQLIGGEVSLLHAEDHVAALEVMRFYGRIPMSFTHGDFSYDYLKAIAVRPDGKRRFDRLDFAVHFDMYMYGRKGIPVPRSEVELHPFRKDFVAMFERLRKEHGVRYYLAHNMTVQRGNLGQVAEVVREARTFGFRLLSFQPAARQGSRQVDGIEGINGDTSSDHGDLVWREIERGAGTRLPYSLFQMGDSRCNRTCATAIVGGRTIPFFDDQCAADKKLRDLVISRFGNIVLPPRIFALKALRAFLRSPSIMVAVILWVTRFIRRAGGVLRLITGGCFMVTFVMHRFMDETDVREAWSIMESSNAEERLYQASPRIRETVERLSACSYGMAQVEERRVVPACVQHSVYDPGENKRLAETLRLHQST